MMNVIMVWGLSWVWICFVLEMSVFIRLFYSLCYWFIGFLVEMNLLRLLRFIWKIEVGFYLVNFYFDYGIFLFYFVWVWFWRK